MTTSTEQVTFDVPIPQGNKCWEFTASIAGSRYDVVVAWLDSHPRWLVAVTNFLTSYRFDAIPHHEPTYIAEKLTRGNIVDGAQLNAVLAAFREQVGA
jgi:hypothetical protein